ncbi:MAG: hypothetical protein H0U52_00655 [Chloroflexi bacterium]|nr:hypothetical protein [Chloroflexota bacterium]
MEYEDQGLGMMNLWPEWIGTPLQMLSGISLVSILGLMIKSQLANRKLSLEEKVLTATTETEARKHLLAEVESLRTSIHRQSERHSTELASAEARYAARAKDAEDRHEECIESRDALRARLIAVEDEMHCKTSALRDLVAGLRRIITQASALHAIEITENLSTDVREAAERVDRLFREGRYTNDDKC